MLPHFPRAPPQKTRQEEFFFQTPQPVFQIFLSLGLSNADPERPSHCSVCYLHARSLCTSRQATILDKIQVRNSTKSSCTTGAWLEQGDTFFLLNATTKFTLFRAETSQGTSQKKSSTHKELGAGFKITPNGMHPAASLYRARRSRNTPHRVKSPILYFASVNFCFSLNLSRPWEGKKKVKLKQEAWV